MIISVNIRHRQGLEIAPTRFQHGISLIEIMVAMVIDILLLLLITAYIIQQSNMRNELEKTTLQMENGRYAMYLIQQDINHAGFYGTWESPIVSISSTPPDPCDVNPEIPDSSTDLVNSNMTLVYPVQGYNKTNPLSCLPDYKTGTDIFVVRRVDTAGTITTPVANELYLQASSTSEASPFDRNLGIQNADLQNGDPTSFALGSLNSDNSIYNNNPGTKADGTTATILKKANVANPSYLNTTPRIAADIHKFHVHIYFISPCSVATGSASDPSGINPSCQSTDDNGNPIPTLKRLELTSVNGTRQFKLVPLVEGIENIQLDYGFDRDFDGSPDSTFLTAPTASDWTNIVVVKVSILSRNVEKTSLCPSTNPPAYCTNVYYLGLNGKVGPFTDGYKRHVYNETVILANPVKRRSQ